MTQTYVAGDITREHIDTCRFTLTVDVTMRLCEERYPTIKNLPFQEKLAVVGLWQDAAELSRADICVLADSFIEARITRDRDRLRSVLISIGATAEEKLKHHFALRAEKTWGENWEVESREFLSVDKPVDMWTLGLVVEAFARWVNQDAGVFSLRCLEALQQFVKLRNAAAHRGQRAPSRGRSYASYETDDICRLIMPVLRILDDLEANCEPS